MDSGITDRRQRGRAAYQATAVSRDTVVDWEGTFGVVCYSFFPADVHLQNKKDSRKQIVWDSNTWDMTEKETTTTTTTPIVVLFSTFRDKVL